MLHERGSLVRQDVLVSALLKLGQAYVDEWPFQDAKHDPLYDRDDPTTLTLISIGEGENEEARYFCEPGGKELFSITYIIYD